MPPPPSKKATLHKLFIVDLHGEYRGEIPLDERCTVEYGEVLEALKGRGLADGQSIFLSEWKVTAISGERMALIAVSTGSLGSEELVWARTALIAAEATLVGELAPAPQVRAEEEVTVAREAPPAPAPALDAREKALKKREDALRMMEENTRAAVAEYRKTTEAQIEDLKAQLAAARGQSERGRAASPASAPERDRARGEFVGSAHLARSSGGPSSDHELEEARGEIEREKQALQRRANEFLEKQETLRDRETKVEEEGRRLAHAREELDRLRAEVEATKAAPPLPYDQAEAKREIDQRVMILQQKAFDLLAREEQLKKRAEEIQALLSGST